MVIFVGNGHSESSSNPGQGCLHFTTNTLRKVMYPTLLNASIVPYFHVSIIE